MAMQIGGGEDGEESANSSINTTPLVDIMLVLLIIFIVTSQVVNMKKVALPAERNEEYHPDAKNIIITVNKDGDIFWRGFSKPVVSEDELFDKMAIEAKKIPQPEVHIRGDQNAKYESIGKTIYTVQRAGIAKVGFVLEPPAKG
jgi:biopolymer transport protein ExbD